MKASNLNNAKLGFTIIELLVSIGIFAVVVTLAISLFNQVLRIQRRTETLRRVNQALRNTTEFLVKEVRNGKIDYGVQDGTVRKNPYLTNCPSAPGSGSTPDGGATYVWNQSSRNQALALTNPAGETECIYYNAGQKAIYLEKLGLPAVQRLTPADVNVTRFEVRVVPGKDPYMDTGGLAEIQPMVQILLVFSAQLSATEVRTISYQTAVSTNIYDIPRE